MKRLNELHDQICTLENIKLADKNARKGKHNFGIINHDKHTEQNYNRLLYELKNLSYTTSKYSQFKIYEPKERIISRLPYYPDRITHWAIMNVMEPIWVKSFINHTYSCIKGRGIHKLANDIKKALKKDVEGTTYCLKLDIQKFYPSIDHEILKRILRRKIKDNKLLVILDEIIDSTSGVPIGNYLSQFFANLYLTYFDHWLLEQVKVKHYFRYADDIVILSDDKDFLKKVLILIKLYLTNELRLKVKPNYKVFIVEMTGIDFIGYVFFHSHTKLRKSIKQRMFKLVWKFKSNKIDVANFRRRIFSYFGWLKYCDSKHLLQKLENETNIHLSNWNGKQSKISRYYNKSIRIIEVIRHNNYFQIHFVYNNKSVCVNSNNKILYNKLCNLKFPINFKIKNHVRTNQNYFNRKAAGYL